MAAPPAVAIETSGRGRRSRQCCPAPSRSSPIEPDGTASSRSTWRPVRSSGSPPAATTTGSTRRGRPTAGGWRLRPPRSITRPTTWRCSTSPTGEVSRVTADLRLRPPSGVEPRRRQRVLLEPARRHAGGISRPGRRRGRGRPGVVLARARLDARRGARRPADRLRPRFGRRDCGSWSTTCVAAPPRRSARPAWTPPTCAGRRTDRGSPSRAWRARGATLDLIDATGGGWRSLGLAGARLRQPAWSPDGRWIVAAAAPDRQRRLGSGADRHRRAGPRASAHVRAVGGPRPIVASGRMSAAVRAAGLHTLSAAVLGAVLVYIVARAVRVPLTYDEATTFYRHVEGSTGRAARLHDRREPSAELGAHLGRAACCSGRRRWPCGCPTSWPAPAISAWSPRSPGGCGSPRSAWPPCCSWRPIPYLLEFFALSRGYGLAVALVTAGGWCLARWCEELARGAGGGTLACGGARPVGRRRRRQLCGARGVRGGLWRGRRPGRRGPRAAAARPAAVARRRCGARAPIGVWAAGHGARSASVVYSRERALVPGHPVPVTVGVAGLYEEELERPSRVPGRRDRPAARGAAQRERALGPERRQRGLGPAARGAAGRRRRQPVDARCDRRRRAPPSRSAQPGIVDALRRRRSAGAPQPARHRLASRRHASPRGVALRSGHVARARHADHRPHRCRPDRRPTRHPQPRGSAAPGRRRRPSSGRSPLPRSMSCGAAASCSSAEQRACCPTRWARWCGAAPTI